METTIATLRANLGKLSDKDRDFASSLLSKRFRSPKMDYWIGELAKRATRGPAAAKTEIGDVSGVLALLRRAGSRLQHPRILIRAQGETMRLSIAGERSSAPGSVTVTSPGDFESRTYYGRIVDGVFAPGRDVSPETATAIGSALRALAIDPAGAAAEYGRLTGFCCFCARALSDGRSTAVGYGEICAGHYGLPWGDAIAA